jgi:hypothetical protein
MGKPSKDSVDQVANSLSALSIHKPRTARHRRRHTIQNAHALVASAMSQITPGDQMEVDLIDYPILLRMQTMLVEQSSSLVSAGSLLRPFFALLKNAPISLETRYQYLSLWQSTVSSLFCSHVLMGSDVLYWSQELLKRSAHFPPLHLALLAVSGVQHLRSTSLSTHAPSSSDQSALQAVYRMRADAERRLLHRTPTEDEDVELCLATTLCLLMFDYLTGNVEEWSARILSAKLWLRQAGWTSAHRTGRNFFWTVARHDRMAAEMRSSPSVLDVDDLLWHPTLVAVGGLVGLDAKMSTLFAKLISIQARVAGLSPHATDVQWDEVDQELGEWRAHFPLSLMTFSCTGSSAQIGPLAPGLMCATGGDAAILLHCLYEETLIQRLVYSTVPGQLAKIHEHAMTLCHLIAPLVPAGNTTALMTLDCLGGHLFVAGRHLRSHEARQWVMKCFDQLGDRTGSLMHAKRGALLENIWREERTRPRMHGLLIRDVPDMVATEQDREGDSMVEMLAVELSHLRPGVTDAS